MKSGKANNTARASKASDAASRLTAPRSHAAPKAPMGANGETGDVQRAARKVFILRRNNLSTSN